MRFLFIYLLLQITFSKGFSQATEMTYILKELPELHFDINNFIQISSHSISVKESFGFFRFKNKVLKTCNKFIINNLNREDKLTEIDGSMCGCAVKIKLNLNNDQSKLSIRLSDSSFNRIKIKLYTRAEESVYGLGEQHSHVNLKGKRIPIWVQEQGIGAGDQPISAIANLKMAAGSPTHSYAPIPFYISSIGYSLQLNNNNRSIFDFRKKKETIIEVWDNELEIIFHQSKDPLKLIEKHSLSMGRPVALPDWAFGSVLGLQGGPEKVEKYINIIEKNGSDISAVWIQDWVGRKRTYVGDQLRWYWETDSIRYPNLENFIKKLNNRGIAVLGYINPMMINAGPLYEEADKNGYFVKNENGDTYIIKMTGFEVGLFDLSNPEAKVWVKNLIKKNLIGAGFEGWMADFGEALPWDAVLFSGISPEEYHNVYPVEWAKINREAIQEANMEGKIAFFSRSAFEGSARFSSFFWAGDQMTSWQRHDGIKSIVPALLSSGMSGMSVNHADVGAFAGFWKAGGLFKMRRTEKLLKRHIELGAFSPVFRTHEGILPQKNCQVYSSEKLAAFYSRFSKIRKELQPYLRKTENDAIEKGLPMLRHFYLHYPEDRNCRNLKYQFMLGAEFIICPQLKRRGKSVRVYLPKGKWKHYFNEKVYEGGKYYKIKSPIGTPAVFKILKD